MNLQFEIVNRDDFVVLKLKGKIIGISDIDNLKQQTDSELTYQKDLILNLKNLKYINSTGINFFVKLFTKTRNNGYEMVVIQAQGVVKNLFEITKLDKVFGFAKNIEEAIKILNKKD